MQLYMSDKAIEFNAVYDDLMRAIGLYKEIEINVSIEESEANSIKRQCDEKALNSISVSETEEIYKSGIASLKKVSESLQRHEIYYTSFNDAENIQREVNNANFNSETLKAFSGATITLLKQINSSDTRDYQSEKKVVDAVYDAAYSMIKMELLSSGKSAVLDWVKTDMVAASFINTLILSDASNLSQDSLLHEDITAMLKKVRRSGANVSYLDEGLILYLAMQDKDLAQKVEAMLMNALNEVFTSEYEGTKQQNINDIAQKKIDELTTNIKKGGIYKNILFLLSLIALVVGIRQGSKALAKSIGHNEYRTTVDYYSSQNAEGPEYPEYMKPIKNYSTTNLIAYSTWNRENIIYGDYQRSIIEYDLSKVDLENLADYSTLDFSELKTSRSDVESKEELDPSELYSEAIVEITRIIQDSSDYIFVPHEESQKIFLVVVSVIDAILLGLGSCFILSNAFKKFRERIENKKLRKEEMIKLTEGLKKYEQLMKQNAAFRERFIQSYKKFEHLIKNSEIKSGFERIRNKNNG